MIEGAAGVTSMTGLFGLITTQVPLVFLTATLYVPAANPVNEPFVTQFNPPLIEYCVGPVPPVAEIVIIPSLVLQFGKER